MNTWDQIPLGDICSKIGSGATPRGGQEAYKSEGISLIRSMNVYDFAFINDGLAFIDDAQANKLKGVTVKANDILINITGASVGRCCIVPNAVLPACVNQHVAIIRLKLDVANPAFVLNAINSPYYKDVILNRSTTGATREALTKEDLSQFKVPLPPLPIQRKIAAILSAYDDLIENNTRRITLIEQMAEEVYREWFVRLRFLGHESVPVHQGGPEGWHRVPIRTFCDEVRSSIKAKDLTADMRYIGLEHIPRKSMFLMDWDSAGNVDSDKLRFVEGDILFGKIRPYLHKVSMTHFSGVCSSDAIVVRAKNPNARGYLFFTLFSDAFVDLAATACKGSQMPRADWDFLKKVEILSPPKPILEAYGRLFEANFRLMEQIALTNEKLLQSRKILLPRLLSGKLDVGYLDIPFSPEIDEPMTATRK